MSEVVAKEVFCEKGLLEISKNTQSAIRVL